MGRIKGITVVLYEKTLTGTDDFGAPIYNETAVEVENVLVSPQGTSEVLDRNNLTGKKVTYTLAIPKGDNHNWLDKKVSFFGQMFRTTGKPVKGIDELIPLGWNQKVTVESYE